MCKDGENRQTRSKHGKNGLEILFAYKTIKILLEEQVAKQRIRFRRDLQERLDNLCFEKAQRFVALDPRERSAHNLRKILIKDSH